MYKLLKPTLFVILLLLVIGSSVKAASFTQSYKSSTQLTQGTVVSLTKTGSDQIEPTTTDNDNLAVGTVADATSGSIVDFQPKQSNTRVTISGETQILVTNSGGDIKVGDNLIISPLAGIATKDNSDSTATKYIGVAKQTFSASSAGAKQVSVQQSDGSKKTVDVGSITATILFGDRKISQVAKQQGILAAIGERVTGREVSTFRSLSAAIILLAVFSVTGWVLYSSIRTSFVSLGRNPLARFNIIINLVRAILIALVVLAAGITISYLVLII